MTNIQGYMVDQNRKSFVVESGTGGLQERRTDHSNRSRDCHSTAPRMHHRPAALGEHRPQSPTPESLLPYPSKGGVANQRRQARAHPNNTSHGTPRIITHPHHGRERVHSNGWSSFAGRVTQQDPNELVHECTVWLVQGIAEPPHTRENRAPCTAYTL